MTLVSCVLLKDRMLSFINSVSLLIPPHSEAIIASLSTFAPLAVETCLLGSLAALAPTPVAVARIAHSYF